MHQGPAGHLPPKGAGLAPAYAGTWRRGLGRRTPCGKTPPGPALHLNGRRPLVPHPGTRCSRKASRPTRPRPPATSQQPGPAGHLNTGSPAPADLGKWTHKRLRARARTRARSAGTDGASPPSWTPQRPGRSGRNSVGRRQPAPPLDTGSRGPCRTPQRRQLAGHEKSTKPAEMVRNLVRKNANLLKISVFCGGERTRTAVQTPHQAAFYTLIRPLVFVPPLPDGGRRRP